MVNGNVAVIVHGHITQVYTSRHIKYNYDKTFTGEELDEESHFIPLFQANSELINTLRPRQNGHRFPDDIFKWIFLNENV